MDALMLQEHRIPPDKLGQFHAALNTIGTLPTPEGGRAQRPLEGFISPATTAGVGGCLILVAAGWAPRHPRHTPLPNGRGQLLEFCGQGEKRLLLVNMYGKAAAAYSKPQLAEAAQIFAQAAAIIKPYTAPGKHRVIIMGGDMNAPWTLGLDRHVPLAASATQPGDAAVRDLFHDFAAQCGVEPLPSAAGAHPPPHAFTVRADRAVAPPCLLPQGCCTATERSCPARLDYLMASLAHHGALIGTGTMVRTAASLVSDHSVIFVDMDRATLLGNCVDVERRTRVAAAKHTKPFLPDTEDRTELFKELAAHGTQLQAATRRLEEARAAMESNRSSDSEVAALLGNSWEQFCELNQAAARKTNPQYFDTRPHKPGLTVKIGQEFIQQKRLTHLHQLYISTKRRPNIATAELARRTTLPQELEVPSISLGRMSQVEKLAEWRKWGDKVGQHLAITRQVSARARRALIKARLEEQWHDVVTKAYKKGGHMGGPYKATFSKQQALGRPTASVLVKDEQLGTISVSCDGPTVRAEVRRYYASMVQHTPANRHPDDPLAAPKAKLPEKLREITTTKLPATYPKLTRLITPERWAELVHKANAKSAPGKSGLTYAYIAAAPRKYGNILEL